MKNLFAYVLLLVSTTLFAQDNSNINSHAVSTIDGIVKEVLVIISGEEAKTRNWEAFRGLFLPNATLSVLYHNDSIPLPVETVTLEEFIELMDDEYYEQGFTEYEIGKVINEYNGLASVFQSYYGKDSEGHEESGINSYQLVYFNDRWWIANLIWTGDSNGVAVPDKYLDK